MIMNPELEKHRSALKITLAENKENRSKIIREERNRLARKYPNEYHYIFERCNALCEEYNIDHLEDLRITGEDIAKYVEENVPYAEPLNE